MYMRNAICLSILIAYVVGASWALNRLADYLGVLPFMAFCIVAFAIMVGLGFAYDHYRKPPSRSSRQ